MIFGLGKKSPEVFWDWFTQHADDYYELDLEDNDAPQLLADLGKRIQQVNNLLTFEIGPGKKGQYELILSADGVVKAIPAVKDLVNAAPELSKWMVKAFRQRKSIGTVDFNNGHLDQADVYFSILGHTDDKIDIELYVAGWDDTESMSALSLLMLDAVLGEYDVMTRIGGIRFLSLDDADKSELRPIIELRKTVDSKKQHQNLAE